MASISQGGYCLSKTQSRVAIEWLLWHEHTEGHSIIHAGRGRKHRTPSKHRLEGYWKNDETGQKFAYEFDGGYWHGCQRCFPYNKDSVLHNDETLQDRYEKTIEVTAEIRSDGYEVIEMWECDFNHEKRSNSAISGFLRKISQQMYVPLGAREAFFGGRTGNIRTHYDVTGDEKIRYEDVCSLYPYVLKTGIYPVGQPVVHVTTYKKLKD